MKMERNSLSAAKVPPGAIIKLLNKIKKEHHELHGLMLVKGGKVIFERFWEPFAAHYHHQLFSLSKSFTSMAVGFAVQEGLLTPETKIADIFTAELEQLGAKIDEKVMQITIKNLLTMSTGIDYESWDEKRSGSDSNHILSFLSSHLKHIPGENFRYSSMSSYMCSAAITRLTGLSLSEYLSPRLFEPLGIENPYWVKDISQGVSLGGFGLNAALEDIAILGQFILQKGAWKGRQLLSAAWIEAATARQIHNGNMDDDWTMGYGYHFWRCVPEGVFRGDGLFGQFCILVPELDMVIAANSNVNMERLMTLFWELLKDIKQLPFNENDARQLAGMDHFTYLTTDQPGDPYPKLRAMYETDAPGGHFYFDFNGHDGMIALFTNQDIPPYTSYFYEFGQWAKGTLTHNPFDMITAHVLGQRAEEPYRIITFGAWEGRTFHATNWCYETAYRDDLRFTFRDDFSELLIEWRGHAYNEPFKTIGKGKRVADQ